MRPRHDRQRGIVLVTAMLLLIVVTIMALSMFRSFGIQERIAGNIREKQRALQAAESTQQYAEWWVSTNSSSSPGLCGALLNANSGQVQICTNGLASPSTVPWQLNSADIGVLYTPPGLQVNATSASNTYAGTPRFYISDMGASADPGVPGEVYRVDAVGYGGTVGSTGALAVVESTFAVYAGSKDLSK